MTLTTNEMVSWLVRSGHPLILQRFSRTVTADSTARTLAELLDRPACVVTEATQKVEGQTRVLDARMFPAERFKAWETMRAKMADSGSPLIVMLDMVSGRTILSAAPHIVSWAGGVRLPVERLVRTVDTEAEIDLGRRALRNALLAAPEFGRRNLGVTVAVDAVSEQLFEPRADATALQRAREELDEGLVLLKRLTEEDLS